METGIVVIVTILIVICTLPFILISGSTKKREKELKKGLETSISDNNGTLTEYVINNNFALGLDSNAQQIYYYKKTPKAEYIQIVNLTYISACEVKKVAKRIGKVKSKYELIQSIALEFTFTKNNAIEEFEFYDYNDTTQLNGELALADTWKKKVIDLLTKDAISLEDSKTQKTALKFA
ncbi:hypothetical protein IMCC3317_15200 [Kordia antarctica]|uniref:Uncharacterized protein n=1 Tax=Kordia antarctica TaxID=1218801 RepID=A0A7L4ZI48_9FLAO|nr:hypothetical protein [Kordia antarctica]QHI36161.1 hypothetical protein IMCC3317_15200 [Kordia antarctica]